MFLFLATLSLYAGAYILNLIVHISYHMHVLIYSLHQYKNQLIITAVQSFIAVTTS